MFKSYIIKINFSIFLFLIFFLINSYTVSKAKNTNFKIYGNEIVSNQTILELIGYDEEMNLSNENINEIIKNLNNSGLFKNVEIITNENEISIKVQENVHISSIVFEGNKVISDDLLIEIIK